MSLVVSAAFTGRASAIGQPRLGFSEATAGEDFQVLGPDWTVRSSLAFSSSETVRVNVTSSTVDWLANAGGGGATLLTVRTYAGAILATALFTQTLSGPVSHYTASIDLSSLSLAPDAYYLSLFIDDTAATFEATSTIRVDAPAAPHSIETYTDDTFTRASDVFTTMSTMWVRIVGDPDSGGDRWDLFEFVDAASPVGGPRGGFADFQRSGSVYTFSIDLAPFAANLQSGWSYTLAVRLANGAFDAGTQIQIFDPTLSVAWTDIAPAQARQGQTDIPMLALTLSLNPNWADLLGPAAFNLERLRITRTGTGANADIAAVHVWKDANGNGALDGPDVRIATRAALGGVPFPAWVGQDGLAMTTVESSGPRHLILTYDISPRASVGTFVGARIAGATDVDFAGRFAAVNGLAAQSTNVEILAASVLTVTNDPGIAPGGATIGQTNVPMDLFHFVTNGGIMTVTELSVTLAGTGTPGDVSQVSLHVDDGDGVFDAAMDPRIGNPAAFPPVGPSVFRNLGLNVDAAGRDAWIVFDISAGATVGHDVGTRLPDNASVVVTGGSVFGGTFPLDSGLTTIGPPSLTVAPTGLAPAQAPQGRTNVVMLRLDLSTDFGQVTVSGFRIDKRGTSTSDGDVSFAKVWLDDGDRLFDLGDMELGRQAFVGGTTVVGGFSLPVGAGPGRVVFLTYDIASAATLGVTVTARLADPGYVAVDASSTVSGANFPIASSPVMIVAPGAGTFLSVGSTDLAAANPTASRGQADVPLERILLNADANQAIVSGLRVDRRGTSIDADVSAVKLYRDTNGNGVLDAGDAMLLSTTFVGGVAVFAGLNLVVVAGQPVGLIVAIDIATTGTLNATVGVRVANANYLSVDANTTVDTNPFPIVSSEVSIGPGSPPAVPAPWPFVATVAIGAVAVLGALGILLVFARRRRRCPVCGKPKAPDREVCPECEEKGLRPGMSAPPPPPPGT